MTFDPANPPEPDETTIEEIIDLFLAVNRQDWSGGTPRTYKTSLAKFSDYLQQADVRYVGDLDRNIAGNYVRWLTSEGYSKPTINNYSGDASRLLEELDRQGLVPPGIQVAIDPPTLDDEEASSDNMLAPDIVQNLLQYYRNDDRAYGTRAHALLEVIWDVMCRRLGVIALDVRDYDPDEGTLTFRHRPDTGTRLKDGKNHERMVKLSGTVNEVLDYYRRCERHQVRDEHGRQPLFASRQGRPSKGTVTSWCYQLTQPCVAVDCPHGEHPPDCDYRQRDQASKCPTSEGPHAIRRGAITWWRNMGASKEWVAHRAASTPRVIMRYYDKPDLEAEMQRHVEDLEADITDHLNVEDLREEIEEEQGDKE